MKRVVLRNFKCPASDEQCTEEDCTQTLCRAEARAATDGTHKQAIKALRADRAPVRWAVAEMTKRSRNSN